MYPNCSAVQLGELPYHESVLGIIGVEWSFMVSSFLSGGLFS